MQKAFAKFYSLIHCALHKSSHTIFRDELIFDFQWGKTMILKAKILRSLGEIIDEDEFVNKKIGIVTPHRAQRSLIQNLLLKSNVNINNNSFIDTVDRFQGQERDLILSSYSVSDKDFVGSEDEFILDSRRFNVSLTRAKRKFIMIISEALLDYLPNDKNIAEDASHLQMFVMKYCSSEEEIEINYLETDSLTKMICKIRSKNQ
jgi:AAA domain